MSNPQNGQSATLDASNSQNETARKPSSKKANSKPRSVKKKSTKKKLQRNSSRDIENATRKRGRKPYPVVALEDVIILAEGIMKHNAGQPVKRETLLKTMVLEAGALSTRNLITNSSKYGLTEGGYQGDTLKLTSKGVIAVDPKAKRVDQMKARFELGISDVAGFDALFQKRKGNNMPAPEMLHDDLNEVDEGDRKPCADVFISNAKYLGLLIEREGAQYLMTFEDWIASLGHVKPRLEGETSTPPIESTTSDDADGIEYDKVCFVLSTINELGHEQRKHADMILSQYIDRALDGTGLRSIRADKIGDPGMISKQIIEYIVRSKLVVADLSFHNPNVFYELALRHVTGKPTVHLIQQSDKIPFDLGNFRTIKLDMEDKYKMVSELDTLRAEISTSIRQALANGESRDNPILTFCPSAKFVMSD